MSEITKEKLKQALWHANRARGSLMAAAGSLPEYNSEEVALSNVLNDLDNIMSLMKDQLCRLRAESRIT